MRRNTLRYCALRGLLASTNYRIEQIPARIGFQDESAFRRLFKKNVEVSLREYRQRFAAR